MSRNNGQAEEHQSMNVDNQTIIHCAAGQLPPDDMLQFFLDKIKPNAFGFSVQNIENGKPDLAITREEVSKLDIEDLKALFANSKDFPITVYLGKRAVPFDKSDIQPFVIYDGDDNPFISIFLEGTLLGHDDPREHSEQYNYVNGLLIPKIVEWCSDFDGDLDKITYKLTGETFKKEFMMNVGHRAVLSIMPCDGEIINLGKNDIGTEPADWGWASLRHGYGDVVVKKEEPKVEAEAPKKKFWGGSGSKTSVPSVAASTVDKNGIHTITGKDGKPVHDAGTPEKSASSLPAKAKESNKAPDIAAKPPGWLHSNDDVKLWYDIISGSVHPAWKKRLPAIVVDFEAVKIDNLESFKAYAMKKKLETTGTKTETSSGKVPTETAKHDVKVISGVAGDKELPIIGAKDLENVLEYVSKYIDGNSQVIADPKDMQAIEKQLPNFAEAVGLNPEDTLNWPLASLIGLGQTDVRALALYATMWRSIARPHVIAAKTVTKTTELGNGSKKVESVVHELAKEELKPAAKKTFWGGKAA